MKIIRTFEVVDDSLYSVLYDIELGAKDDNQNVVPEDELHEFSRLFEFWNDPIRLRFFFETHIDDLNDEYWDGISVEEAIIKTKKEAKILENQLIEFAIIGKSNHLKNLSMLFKPLSEGKFEKKFEKDKVKVDGKKSWLRLYAIRIDVNVFLVCGGAIKLRKTLNDREYLLKEIEKLNITQAELSKGNNDKLDFFELY